MLARTLITCATLLAHVGSPPPPVASAARPSPPAAEQWPLDADHFDAPQVWRLSQGAGQVVAVIDSGVDGHQSNLSANLLRASGNFSGEAGTGLTDASQDSHGTSVAGVIAALAPRAKILSVRVLVGQATNVDPVAVAEGVGFAVSHGATVINISLATVVNNPQLAAAIRGALERSIPVVAAAGNAGQSGNPVDYPAALPGVVAVGGSDMNGNPWPQSETGAYVDLAAPAEQIRSTASGGGYVTANGTSYAAPYVSAALALLRSRFPTETLPQQLYRLASTATPLRQPTPSDVGGFGVIDPLAALTASEPPRAIGNPLARSSAAGASNPGSTHRDVSGLGGWLIALIVILAAVVLIGGGVFWRRRRS